MRETWIIYSKKLDKWSFWDSIEGPGAPVSEEVALQCLNKLLDAIVWHDKSDTEECIIWKFEV